MTVIPAKRSTAPLALFSRYMPDRWVSGAFFATLVMSIPLLTVIASFFYDSGGVWQHLSETVLEDYVVNSLLLVFGVCLLAGIMGVVTAWLTSMCEFPGRRYFQWLLLLPMAMPAYIIAFTYTGLLEVAGPIQTMIRSITGLAYGEYWFPQIRSLPGAMWMLGLVLYPYVYMLTRAALLEQSVCVLEVSRTLGYGPWRCLQKVALPLARPALAVGLSLVAMETLADYGAVHYFGVSTFTTGIFRTWFGLNNATAALQLSSVLLGFIFLLVLIERASRRDRRFYHTSSKYSDLPRYRLGGRRAIGAFLICLLPFALGFMLPAGQLLLWALIHPEQIASSRFLQLVWHSLWLAALTAIISVMIALLIAYTQRLHNRSGIKWPMRFAGMGYAIPGVVIAVGVLVPFAWLDHRINDLMRLNFAMDTSLLFSGTVFILIFAYLVRFQAVSLQTLEAAFAKIKPSMDDVARSLRATPARVLTRVHIPILRGSLLTAALLVFVDVLKELPATSVLRPYDFNTLAVHAYELASDERLQEAALPSLAIVAAGLIPVIILSRSIERARPGQHAT